MFHNSFMGCSEAHFCRYVLYIKQNNLEDLRNSNNNEMYLNVNILCAEVVNIGLINKYSA